MTKIILSRHGGKTQIAKWIVSHFPQHEIYLEPFCGSCAVLFAKPVGAREVVNDIDSRIVALFERLRENPWIFAAALWATPYAQHNWRDHIPDPGSFDDAVLDCAKEKQFYIGDRSTWANGATGGKSKTSVWADWFTRALPAASRLKDVTLLNEDALKAIERFADRSDALIYVDPPYIGHEDEYLHRVDYDALVAALLKARAKVLISEYEPAVTRFPGWHVTRRKTTRRAASGRHGKCSEAIEVLIANYPFVVDG